MSIFYSSRAGFATVSRQNEECAKFDLRRPESILVAYPETTNAFGSFAEWCCALAVRSWRRWQRRIGVRGDSAYREFDDIMQDLRVQSDFSRVSKARLQISRVEEYIAVGPDSQPSRLSADRDDTLETLDGGSGNDERDLWTSSTISVMFLWCAN